MAVALRARDCLWRHWQLDTGSDIERQRSGIYRLRCRFILRESVSPIGHGHAWQEWARSWISRRRGGSVWDRL
jgi:hypothetical protein